MAKKIVTEVAKKAQKAQPAKLATEKEPLNLASPRAGAQNLEFDEKDGRIVITAVSAERLRPSQSGRSQIVASTNGLHRLVVGGTIYDIVVSISVPNNPHRKFGGFEPLAK